MVNHEIRGDWSQSVLCRLHDGQEMYADIGRFVWKTPNVSVDSRTPARGVADASRGRGLLGRALSAGTAAGRKAASGTSIAFPHFRANGGSGLCSFAGAAPGEVRHIELDGLRSWTVVREAFVAAEVTLGFAMEPGAGKDTGPELVRFAGPGSLFIAGGGTFVDLNPADHGGVIDAGVEAVVAFEDGVTMTIFDTASGLSSASFKGDGKVILRA